MTTEFSLGTGSKDQAIADKETTGKLGTFAGVFTPSVLTILGIILFLRLGYVVGNAGIGKSLIILVLANTISILTSISLSAVATNLKVKGGGDYYLISRTLGMEFGGSIGLVLFLAQSISVAFYCIGFAEAVAVFVPSSTAMTTRLIAFGAVSFLFVFAWLGSDWATKFQFVVMALLIAALGSFFWGGFTHWDSALLTANWVNTESTVPFWILFAIFFPAVTGFTQGVSMSGDLADPGKSLPLGTFLAVGVSILVYLASTLIFSASLPNQQLASNYGAMKSIAKYGFLIDAGVVAATLSSAMASFMGAPRILQSLSADRIFSVLNPFAKGSGPTNNPRRGILLSAAIAIAVIALGQLNLVARVVSMFFLISYGLLNYATFFEARTASPSFRPRFKWFSPHLSLAGFLICAGVMLAIDPKSGAAAIAVLFAIHQYLKRTDKPARWADSSRAYHMQQARNHILAAGKELSHDRDWQPRLLILDHGKEKRDMLLTFSSWIEGGSGFATALHIHEGEGLVAVRERNVIQKELTGFIRERDLPMVPLAVWAPEFSEALETVIQSTGFGPITPNTVVLNWFDKPGDTIPCRNQYAFVQHLRTLFRAGFNIVVMEVTPRVWDQLQEIPAEQRFIDVWWQDDATSRLMLLFAHLMTRNKTWHGAVIRVLTKGNGTRIEAEKKALGKILENVRIEAQAVIVPSFASEVVVENSRAAAMVFLPFTLKANHLTDPTGKSFVNSLPRLPITALVLAAEDIDLESEPEEGATALIAAASDALEAADKKAERAEKRARAAREALNALNAKLAELENGTEKAIIIDEHKELKQELTTAEEKAEKAFRSAAKAKTKAVDAQKTAEEIMDDAAVKKMPGKG
ncbi:putative Na-K-Cl cotransporter [Desulforapulum autotrophicum HRM2]|uniref:Na-K-Cl cotransporter n=1 Tax=Desulforapulum autotrophicum (strain ATCC 43914 / DSM 3382 / VKM B-1955 / HRM2) TaxID=177437 RepID=C0QL53_DESAH|nr:amino acid permease [Desulforapulum autotrophicum]ACN14139.1 putative Na-K-Cl cotransporter [Desulforapulum autotrophicum HRM2]